MTNKPQTTLFVVHPNTGNSDRSVLSFGWKVLSALAIGQKVEVRLADKKLSGVEATQIFIDEVAE